MERTSDADPAKPLDYSGYWGQEHAQEIHRIARQEAARLGVPRPDWEDIAQEAALRLFSFRPRFSADRGTWIALIRAIAGNFARDGRKRQALVSLDAIADRGYDQPAPTGDGVGDTEAARILLELIRAQALKESTATQASLVEWYPDLFSRDAAVPAPKGTLVPKAKRAAAKSAAERKQFNTRISAPLCRFRKKLKRILSFALPNAFHITKAREVSR